MFYLIPITPSMGNRIFSSISITIIDLIDYFRYSFAIVGINLTHMSYMLWKDGTAKTHIYNICHKPNGYQPNLKHFHRFYCHLFFEFDKLWLAEKPSSIMEFSRIRDLFEKRMRSLLADRSCVLKSNFLVEDI